MINRYTTSRLTAPLGLAFGNARVITAPVRESKRQRKARRARERAEAAQTALVILFIQEEQRKARFLAQMRAGKERAAQIRAWKSRIRPINSAPVARTFAAYYDTKGAEDIEARTIQLPTCVDNTDLCGLCARALGLVA